VLVSLFGPRAVTGLRLHFHPHNVTQSYTERIDVNTAGIPGMQRWIQAPCRRGVRSIRAEVWGYAPSQKKNSLEIAFFGEFGAVFFKPGKNCISAALSNSRLAKGEEYVWHPSEQQCGAMHPPNNEFLT